MATASYRATFFRLLGFLRPYKGTLYLSVGLAIVSQLGSLAFPYLTGKVITAINEDHRSQVPRLIAIVLVVGVDQGGVHARAAADLGQAGARGGARPAERDLREARAALVRLLRPAADGPADVARDRRPAGRPLLPRLRPDLLLPARLHRGRGGRAPLRGLVEARARRARDRCLRWSRSRTATATCRTRCCATCSRRWRMSRPSPRRTSSACTS